MLRVIPRMSKVFFIRESQKGRGLPEFGKAEERNDQEIISFTTWTYASVGRKSAPL
jgi:hypothetical protein